MLLKGGGTGEIAQISDGGHHKHEDMMPVHRSHAESQVQRYVVVCHYSAGAWEQTLCVLGVYFTRAGSFPRWLDLAENMSLKLLTSCLHAL